MKKMFLLIATLVPFLLAGPSRAADVQANWTKHCTSCHGKDGKGQTKAGRMANVKDMTEAGYQASFDDARAQKQIKEGMKDEKGKERMKPFGDKLNDDEIKALVAYVRSLKK
jgi:cytochrome c553